MSNAEMGSVVETKVVVEPIVLSVLSNTGFIVLIAETVRKVADRAGNE